MLVASKAIDIAPHDVTLVLLAAANVASLGLKTIASEVLDLLPTEAATHEGVVQLRSILGRLGSDRITGSERIGAATVNLQALASTHPGAGARCREAFDRWQAQVDQVECFRTIDGNVVRRPAGTRGLSACLSMSDQRTQAREFAAQAVPATELLGRPLVIEGLCPPWIFGELMEASSTPFNGFRRRVMLVQADPVELLEGMSLADLRGLLSQERLEVFTGPDAARQLAESMAARLETALVGQYIPVLATRQRAQPPIEQVLRAMEAEQKAEHVKLSQQVEGLYRGRDAAWWKQRYESGEPLRVLIPTCRFSTFVRYSSQDLADAFTAGGHQARVFMEPDEHSSLSSVGYLRQIAEFQPDMIVLINYPRATMGANFPANIPFICWVQDAMPHLFDPSLGAAQGPMDFMAGVRLTELVNRFGYPASRCLPMPIVVSSAKFSSGERVAPAQGVEIVFATHHGETPEAMHDRLVKDAGKDPVLPRAMELLRPLAMDMGRTIWKTGAKKIIRDGVLSAVRNVAGVEANDRAVSVLTHAYVIPLADRVLRHEVAGWAGAIARRRGWNLRLQGKNWDTHPTLAEFAAGTIEHGDDLRDSYARATVHLHASYHGPMHQRVFECALAGGLALCRLVWPTVSPLLPAAMRSVRLKLGEGLAAAAARVENGAAMVPVRDHAELRAVADLIRTSGLPPLPGWEAEGLCPIPLKAPAIMEADDAVVGLVLPMVDASFSSEAALEAMIEKAQDPAWRRERSEAIARRVRADLTHEAMAQRLIEMVGARVMTGSASHAGV